MRLISILALAALAASAPAQWIVAPGSCPGGTCPNVRPAAPAQYAQPAAAEKPDPATWFALKIEVQLTDDGTSKRFRGGSGTPVAVEDGKTLVLTNAHVVRDTTKDCPISVVARGKRYPAKYLDGTAVKELGFDSIDVQGPDLCFLVVDADLGHVDIRETDLEDGEAVYHWGYGGVAGLNPPYRGGKAVLADRISNADRTVVLTATSVSGDSGAGVFDTHGKLVGVVWGRELESGRALAVPLKSVKRFFERPLLAKLFPRLAKKLAQVRGIKEVDASDLPKAKTPDHSPAEKKDDKKDDKKDEKKADPKTEGLTPPSKAVPKPMPGPGKKVVYPYPGAQPIFFEPSNN